MLLWQGFSSGWRSARRRLATLRHGCHQRLRVRVMLKTHFFQKILRDMITFRELAGGASLCTILPRRRRKTFSGSSLGLLGLSRMSRWYKSALFIFCIIIWGRRWSGTCKRTSARALGLSQWPTTRRLLLPFRSSNAVFDFVCLIHLLFCTICTNISFFQSLNGYTLGNRVLQVSFKTNNRKV